MLNYLKPMGYMGEFKLNLKSKFNDGCAIFYKKDMFKLNKIYYYGNDIELTDASYGTDDAKSEANFSMKLSFFKTTPNGIALILTYKNSNILVLSTKIESTINSKTKLQMLNNILSNVNYISNTIYDKIPGIETTLFFIIYIYIFLRKIILLTK